jgi:hypothetical protein
VRNEWAAHGHFAQPGLQCDLFQGGVALTPASTGTREGSNPEPAAPIAARQDLCSALDQ